MYSMGSGDYHHLACRGCRHNVLLAVHNASTHLDMVLACQDVPHPTLSNTLSSSMTSRDENSAGRRCFPAFMLPRTPVMRSRTWYPRRAMTCLHSGNHMTLETIRSKQVSTRAKKDMTKLLLAFY